MAKRAIIYSRVSTDDQAKESKGSLKTQVEACAARAKLNGYLVTETFREDFSGAEYSRPELDKILELAYSKSFDVLIVYDIDRLSRRASHQYIFEETFKKHGVVIEYINNDFADTLEGQLQRTIYSAFAEYERMKILERSLRGRRAKAKAGFVITGGVAPFGYNYIRNEHGGLFELNEADAKVVKQIYQWYIYGDEFGKRMGFQQIAEKLSESSLPTPFDRNGHKKRKDVGVWSRSTINKIITSETYKGDWYYKGKTLSNQDEPKIRVSVPAIVSCDEWELAQSRLKKNKISSKRNIKHFYLLRNRIKCDMCGSTMNCYHDNNSDTFYYRCAGGAKAFSNDGKTQICKRSYSRVERFDRIVWKFVSNMLKNPQLIFSSIDDLNDQKSTKLDSIQLRIDIVQNELKAIQEQKNRAIRLYTLGISENDVASVIEELNLRHTQMSNEFAELLREQEAIHVSDDSIQQIADISEQISMGIDHFTDDDKLAIMGLLNVNCVLHKGETKKADTIEISGLFPTATADVWSTEFEFKPSIHLNHMVL